MFVIRSLPEEDCAAHSATTHGHYQTTICLVHWNVTCHLKRATTGLKASMSHAPLTSGDAPAPHWLWKK